MATVQKEIQCPNCGFGCATKHYNCRSDEEDIYCIRCGYGESTVLEDGKLVTHKYLAKGSYIVRLEGNGTIGSYTDDRFIAEITKDHKAGNILNGNGDKATEIYYTYQVNGIWFVKDVIKDESILFEKCEELNNIC